MRLAILTGMALGCASFSAPAPAAAQAAAPAAPAWAVTVAPAQCTLARVFPPAGDNAISLTTLTGSDSYRLTLAGAAIPHRAQGSRFPVVLDLSAADARFPTNAMGAAITGKRGALTIYGLKADFVAALGNATSITLTAGQDKAGPFDLAKARGAVAAFKRCVQDQLVEWGADAAQFAAGGATPVALRDRDLWLPNDRLVRMKMTSDGAIKADFRLGVAVDGSIDSCTPLEVAPKAENTKIVCDALMGKKMFTPAHDAGGHAVRGVAAYDVEMIAVAETSTTTIR